MKNKQGEKQDEQVKRSLTGVELEATETNRANPVGDPAGSTKIKSLFCYGNEETKKMIWSLKTNPRFYNSEDGEKLIKFIGQEIQINENTIVICAPSSSFWQNKKNFDHMNVFMKKCIRNLRSNSSSYLVEHVGYIPYAIVPRLSKGLQKGLNKIERKKQTLGAYGLSNYFKYLLKYWVFNNKKIMTIKDGSYAIFNILIIDDVKTTGSTLLECAHIVDDYLNSLFSGQKNNLVERNNIHIKCLTVAYEA